MSQNVYQKLGHRVSEEVQLLAEKKWIIEALSKIKRQRNSLQIERLHLESLKSKLNISSNKKDVSKVKEAEDELTSVKPVHLMQNYNSGKNALQPDPMDEAICNDEELDLRIDNFHFDKMDNMEEDEESDEENMLIDINMLMNGTFR